MPLLDIATPQPSLRISYHTLYHGTYIFGWEKRLASSWKSFGISEKAKNLYQGSTMMQRSGLVIRAVDTLETKFSSIQRTDGKNNYLNSQLSGDLQSENGEETEVGEREMLRRKRISRANKGNTPWNKGRKHTPETLRRIKERTKIAMQNPKVKMKLADLGRAQRCSEEKRIKIGLGVRIRWEKRREKRKLQETCHYEWQNLIAEASRRGCEDQVELQWNSYEIIDEYLSYFDSTDNMNQLFLVALVLDPRFKLRYFERVLEKMMGYRVDEVNTKGRELKDLIVKLTDMYATSNATQASDMTKENIGSNNASRHAIVVSHEVERYLLDPIEKLTKEFDILNWWKINSTKYPNLQLLAKDVLAIQVRSVASESSFIDPHRSSLTPRSVQALISLQNWLKSDSISSLAYEETEKEMDQEH